MRIATAKNLHRQAMEHVDLAFAAQQSEDRALHELLIRRAFEYELAATEAAVREGCEEPTRSILHRSAATLAIECNELARARKLIESGLDGNPPPEIAGELKELLIALKKKSGKSRRSLKRQNAKVSEGHAPKESLLPPPLEMEVLKALWDLGGESNVRKIQQELLPQRTLAYTAVMSLLERLARKGAVKRRKAGRSFLYASALDLETMRRKAVGEIVESLFEGSTSMLGSFLLSQAKPVDSGNVEREINTRLSSNEWKA